LNSNALFAIRAPGQLIVGSGGGTLLDSLRRAIIERGKLVIIQGFTDAFDV
jgi:hypothetical protein